MKKDYIHKQFYKYVIPSMFAMLLSGFYAIVDGLFVGNANGNDALAAINLVWPIQALLNATAVGIGIGGAVLISTFLGENKDDKANHTTGLTLLLLLMAGIILPAIMLLFLPNLLGFLGAEGAIYSNGMEYIRVILIGGLLAVFGNGLNPIIRNYGKTYIATIIMCCGLITNVILDYYLIFVLGWGLHGAAVATITAQGIVAIVSLIFLYLLKKDVAHIMFFRWDFTLVKRIFMIALSPFGQTIVPSIVIILTNWQCIKYGGNDAVTIFSVVSYILASVQMLLQGIGDGVQPLLSFYHGSKKEREVHILYHKSLMLTLLVSGFLCVSVLLLKTPLTALFGIDESIQAACGVAVMITAFAFPLFGITRLTSAFFYAVHKPKCSTFIVYIEPLVILPICLLSLASLLQMEGIWIAYPSAQFVLCAISLWMKRPSFTQIKQLYTVKKIPLETSEG